MTATYNIYFLKKASLVFGSLFFLTSLVMAQKGVGLRNQAGFKIGVAVTPDKLTRVEYAAVVAREFSSLTAENAMKPKYTWVGENEYNFEPGEQILSFANEHNMQVHGHTLVWHFMPARWMEETFPDYDSATLESALKQYIYTVAGHYRGRVVSWDVVNEVFSEGGSTMRNSIYYKKLGDDYPARLFQYAREADPGALLFYNDYSLASNPVKLKKTLDMIDDFQQRGIPIDGVGLQMHIDLNLDLGNLQRAVDQIVSRGLKIHLSEVDIKANPEGKEDRFSPALAEAQRAMMRKIVAIYDSIPDENKFAITMWGLRDSDSWLNYFTDHQQWPLLFDQSYQPKPMYKGFTEGLQPQ